MSAETMPEQVGTLGIPGALAFLIRSCLIHNFFTTLAYSS